MSYVQPRFCQDIAVEIKALNTERLPPCFKRSLLTPSRIRSTPRARCFVTSLTLTVVDGEERPQKGMPWSHAATCRSRVTAAWESSARSS